MPRLIFDVFERAVCDFLCVMTPKLYVLACYGAVPIRV